MCHTAPRAIYRESRCLLSSEDALDSRVWTFHDEEWNRIKFLPVNRDSIRRGLPVYVEDNTQPVTSEIRFSDDEGIRFIGTTSSKDEWLCLILDPAIYNWTAYSLECQVKRDSAFRELQFAFHYQDLYNRLRYRFENDHLYFDEVNRFRFRNSLNGVPFRMQIGTWYDLRIEVFPHGSKCYINGTLMMTDYNPHPSLNHGSIAIILWEDNGHTDIRANIRQLCVHQLESVL